MSELLPADPVTAGIDAMRGRYRRVHGQRARKLRRRGELVWWDVTLQSLVWVKHD